MIKVNAKDPIGKNVWRILYKLNNGIISTIRNNQTPKQKTWDALKSESTYITPPLKVSLDRRVWIRGDGSRYKELNSIRVNDFLLLTINLKGTKRSFKTKEDIMEFCWNEIITAKNAKRLGELSCEFGTRDTATYHEIYRVGKMVFINRPWGIDYASTSILRNGWVWRLKE